MASALALVACGGEEPDDSSDDGGGGTSNGSGGASETGGAGGADPGGTGGAGGDGSGGEGSGGDASGGTDSGGSGGSGDDDDQDDDGTTDEDDVDVDGDGLVEVNSWTQLDGIRHAAGGTGRWNGEEIDTTGCPTTSEGGCDGYELTIDLDFDSDGNGEIDFADEFFDPEGDGSGRGWIPIPTFFGTFDGNGHEIRSLRIYRQSQDQVGLFGSIQTTTGRSSGVKNLVFRAAVVEGRKNVGVLAGQILNLNSSLTDSILIEDVDVQGAVSSVGTGERGHVGGLVGQVVTQNYLTSRGARVWIEGSRFDGDVGAPDRVGGLVGVVNSTEGGFVTITDSHALGTVSGYSNTASYGTGGLVGVAYASDSQSGASFDVLHSFAIVQVIGSGACTGGLVGRMDASNGTGELVDSFAAGIVDGTTTTGGLVGCLATAGTGILEIERNYVVGAVSGGEYTTGALFASLSGTLNIGSNHYASDTTGVVSAVPLIDDADASTAATAEQLACPTSPDNTTCASSKTLFDDWSTDLWDIGGGDHLPGLVLADGIYRPEYQEDGYVLVKSDP